MPVIRTDKMKNAQRDMDRLVREHGRLVRGYSPVICADLGVVIGQISDEANAVVSRMCEEYKLPEGVITVNLKQFDDTMDDTEKMDIILENVDTVDKLKAIERHTVAGRIRGLRPDFSAVLDAIPIDGNLTKSLLSKGVV